jgi:hypothetical protein
VNAEHARPMMAYVALCLAASYVLSQGVVAGPSTGPVNIARAGGPVRMFADVMTLSAAQEILTVGGDVASEPIRSVVADSIGSSDPVRRVTNTVAATTPKRAPQHVAPAKTLTPATQPATAVHGKAAAEAKKASRVASRIVATGSGKAAKAPKSAKADKPAKARKR